MTRVQSKATKREWAHVQEYGHGPRIARDPWLITRLIACGAITPSQHGAALRVASLMERGAGQTGGGHGEAVDGSRGDLHARMYDATLCSREAECAMNYARTHMPAPAELRICILDTALSFPHRSLSAAMRAAEMPVNKRYMGEFIDHLMVGLELLVTYFDALDAQHEREARKRA